VVQGVFSFLLYSGLANESTVLNIKPIRRMLEEIAIFILRIITPNDVSNQVLGQQY